MKANITNLKRVLKLCAKAHNATFHDWSCEGQLGIHSETMATIYDVRMICQSFGLGAMMVEPSNGYVTVWLDEKLYRNKAEVDLDRCAMALPYGTEL